MRTPKSARTAALALLGVFVALLVAVHGTPVASSGPSLAAPTLTSAPTNPSSSTSATFGFSSATATGFRCARDGAAFSACTSPVTYSGLTQGAHHFSVKAVVGAAESVTTDHAWVVDSVAPPAPDLTARPADPTANATNTAAWTSPEAGVSFQCSVENGAFKPCTTPFTWVIDTANNQQHQLAVRSVDAAGNVSPAVGYQFKYQKGLPESGLPFTVSGSVTGLTPGVWRPVVATVGNPNPVTIRVSSLTVSVGADSAPSGCAAATNLELQQSNASVDLGLLVPAGGTVTLPAQGVTSPRLRLRNLPTVNQDVCKNKTFTLTWSGTASN